MTDLELARALAEGSLAQLKVGAVITKRTRTTRRTTRRRTIGKCNYNLLDGPCELLDGTTSPTLIHAEAAVIAQAAKVGIPLEGATITITVSPCYACARLIIASGIKHVQYEHKWWDKAVNKFLRSKGVRVTHLKEGKTEQ